MANVRQVQEIQRADGNMLYLYYSNLPIARTKEFANGEINVDLDEMGNVVGIEVLSLESEELSALQQIASQYQLSLGDLQDNLKPTVSKWTVDSGDKSASSGSLSTRQKEWFGASVWRKIVEAFSSMNKPKGPRAKA